MKKHIYKILLLLLSLILLFSLAACADGKSAYDIWLEQGHTGTESDFIDWLKGNNGDDGDSGTKGLSAYEIYLKYHTEYKGTEAQWLNDLINGRLATPETYQVEYKAGTGGTISGNTNQAVKYGESAEKVAAVCNDGYIFDKWTDGVETLERLDKNITNKTTVTALFKQSPLVFDLTCTSYRVRIATDLKDTVEQIIIPSHYGGYPVTEIADVGFIGCPELRLVVLPETLTRIGINAFFNCVNLQTAYMPKIERIDTGAFGYCLRLRHIYLPSSLTITGDSLFKRPDSADPLTVHIEGAEESTAPWSDYWQDDCTDIEVRYNNYYTDYSDLSLDLLTESDTYSVRGQNRNLTELHLPPVYNDKFITEIPIVGFSFCKQLTDVILPASIKKIETTSFRNCHALETIYLASVENINQLAFIYCPNITSIIFPISVKYAGASIFLHTQSETLPAREKPLIIYVEAKEEDTADWAETWSANNEWIEVIYDYRNA